jgi:RNA polymerase sigma-70 factor (ECF subfamily)
VRVWQDLGGTAPRAGSGLGLLMTERPGVADREEEFERLVIRHRPLMTRAIWRVTRDADLAEDALQDALTKLWTKLPLVRAHPNPRALVLRICLNTALDAVRSRQRQRRRDAPLEEAAGATSESQARAAEGAAVTKDVRAALAKIKPRQATALLLRVVHGEPYAVVAQALGCNESTARVHVLRAREKLRRWLSRPSALEAAGDRR